jgi:hypothetical protein
VIVLRNPQDGKYLEEHTIGEGMTSRLATISAPENGFCGLFGCTNWREAVSDVDISGFL